MIAFRLQQIEKIDKLIDKYNVLEIKKQFLKEDIKQEILDDELIYMIESANILALSNKHKNRKRALKIATIIPNIRDEYEFIVGCKIVLNKLKSFLTLKRLNDIHPEFSTNSISIVEQLRQKYEIISNTVDIMDKEVVLSNIQYSIYQLIKSNKNISISAPTSAGKSYILSRVVVEQLNETNQCIVYVVPTRALINQVITDLREHMNSSKYFITSSSDTRKLKNGQVGVFVLTQERLYQLCNNRNVEIGTLIIDEAQNIMNGSRGVLLEYSIKYSRSIWKNIRTIFLSPLINNPDKLLEKFNNENEGIYNSKEYPVRQNIIKLIRLKGRGYQVKLNNKIINDMLDIVKGNTLDKNIVNAYMKFNNGEKSIIYCNYPEMTQTICKELYDRDIMKEKKDNQQLTEFADFLERNIDKNYMLVKYIKRGLAFHYGSLPTFIRMGIESLANKGFIDIMVCTSTLLQGVNIPAQNIYIFNPRRSRVDRLDNLDFWNLVGRAGRTGYDLNGNIILVDTPSWDNIDRYDEKDIKVKYATELNETQIKDVENAFEYNEYNSNKKDFIDSIESALVFDYVVKSENGVSLDSEIIEEHIKECVSNYSEVKGLLIKLIGVRPQNIQNVWDIFKNNDEYIESYMVFHPFREEFLERYIEIINTHLMNGTLYNLNPYIPNNKNKSLMKLVFCSLRWMKGEPLKRILFYKFNEFNDENAVTKQVEKQVKYLNSDIRYRLIKGMYAYQEILKEYLIRTNKEFLLEKLPNIAMFLELGACDDTAIELISLGLIRELALELTGKIKVNDGDLITKIKELDISTLGLSKYEEERLQDFIGKL